MSPIAIGILAVGMSIDAFVASLGRGAGLHRPRWTDALRTGVVFGIVEAITPVIGWAAGLAATRYIQQIDHWVAFVLLGAVGGRMALHALSRQTGVPAAPASKPGLALVATAVGTSIDAMAIGVSLAFLDVNILVIALAIGVATTIMSTTGVLAGRLLGQRFGRWAEIVGGLALVGLGSMILFEHLTAG